MFIFICKAICIFIIVLLLICLFMLLIQSHEIKKQLKILQEEEQELLFRKK